MGRIKYIAPAAEVAGTIGGVTYARAYGVQTVRAWRAPVNQRTDSQRTRRRTLAQFASRWFTDLTSAQRTAWDTYAATVSFTDSLGKTYYIKGYNMFLRTNLTLELFPTAEDLIAPVGVGLPTTRTHTFTFTHATGVLDCDTVAPAGLAADRLFFQVFKYNRITRNHFKFITHGWVDAAGNVALPLNLANFTTPLPDSAGDVAAWVNAWYYDSDNRITNPTLYKIPSS